MYTGLQLTKRSPSPHYLMISSSAMADPDQLFYRKRLPPFSVEFFRHVIITLLRRKRTLRGMTMPNLLNDMYSYQITKSVVLPIEYDDGIERSSQLIAGCRGVPEVIPFCSVHPKDPEKIQKLHKYMQMGARGLKLHPNFQQIRPDEPENFELYEEYAGYRFPLMVHSGLTGQEGCFRPAKKFSALEFIEAVPKNFPDLPVVLAHAGIAQYEKGIVFAQKYPNVYLELSGQPVQHIQQTLSVIGADRLLFGTDWPFWNQAFALQAVRQATKHDHSAEQCILHENAERLLRI